MQEGDRKGDYARVRMEVKTNSGKSVPIYYTLFQRDHQLRVINVYVNGLDLRDTFQSQFAQGMQQYNDIDKVIDNWSADANIDAGIEGEDQKS
jgi:phospholipid transport system substrate-binding protein